MSTESLQRLLVSIFNMEACDRASMTVEELLVQEGIDTDSSCQTYQEAGVLTNNLGIVVTGSDGVRVQVTLVDAGVR